MTEQHTLFSLLAGEFISDFGAISPRPDPVAQVASRPRYLAGGVGGGIRWPRWPGRSGIDTWIVEHQWRIEHVGITVASEKAQGERIIRYETAAGTLTARWSLGPNGDWWQTEYPIKTLEDLATGAGSGGIEKVHGRACQISR